MNNEIEILYKLNKFHLSSPIILCIGTDKVTGDALGPMVGQLLTQNYDLPAYVYGTLSRPITALNLETTVGFLKLKHPSNKIIAIDSSIGQKCDIGEIKVLPCGIFPGAADNKKLPFIGDYGVTATVATNSADLFNVRLGLIYELSRTISQAISKMDCMSSLYKLII